MHIYETDGHCSDFTAEVRSCEAVPGGLYELTLSQTAFFPEGGGQSSDHGTLGGQEVLKLRADDARAVVYHTVRNPVAPGSTIEGHVDMEKRFSDMQNHTAEHIISGLIHSRFGYDNVGFHMGNDGITMDFNGILQAEQLANVELLANEAVYANLSVKISFYTPEAAREVAFRSKKELAGTVRLVEIEGVDRCACCAPHVSRTGEIGLIKIVNCQSYKGGVRVSMLAGKRAFAELSKRFIQVKSLSTALSAKMDEVERHVQRLQAESIRAKAERTSVLRNYYLSRAQSIQPGESALLFEETGTADDIRNFVKILMERTDGICAVFLCDHSSEQEQYRFVIGSRSRDLRNIADILRKSAGASCGGRPELIQGCVAARKEQISDLLYPFYQ